MRKVGFIGLSVKGGPKAANLIKKRFPLTVSDINPEASDIVVTMPPEPRRLEQVASGPDGIGVDLKTGGLDMDDSPVGKTSELAATGMLPLMVGGSAATKSRKTA